MPLEYKYIYGPVLSRRLGISLGVDIIPFKTCCFDCIYCQLGKTTKKTIEREAFFNINEILMEIENFLKNKKKIDYITFSGSGEPTLNKNIKEIIQGIKNITDVPVAVFTNCALLYQEEVFSSLLLVDLVKPSLDAFDEITFRKINRPCPNIKFNKIVDSLIKFRNEFNKQMWLEIMLVKNLNDNLDRISEAKEIIKKIKPDKIHLNTVVRPPTEKYALPLEKVEMEKINRILCSNCEIIVVEKEITTNPLDILNVIKRRPITIDELAKLVGLKKNLIIKEVENLIYDRKIKVVEHQGIKYYVRNI